MKQHYLTFVFYEHGDKNLKKIVEEHNAKFNVKNPDTHITTCIGDLLLENNFFSGTLSDLHFTKSQHEKVRGIKTTYTKKLIPFLKDKSPTRDYTRIDFLHYLPKLNQMHIFTVKKKTDPKTLTGTYKGKMLYVGEPLHDLFNTYEDVGHILDKMIDKQINSWHYKKRWCEVELKHAESDGGKRRRRKAVSLESVKPEKIYEPVYS